MCIERRIDDDEYVITLPIGWELEFANAGPDCYWPVIPEQRGAEPERRARPAKGRRPRTAGGPSAAVARRRHV